MMTIIAVIFVAWLALMILYMLAIMPRMIGKADRKPFLGVLYAHRGLHDNETDAPENSMKAFAKAVDAGFGIELDIQLSKDKIPVVFHDFTLDRICGVKGKVCDYTYAELEKFRLCKSEEKIPKFEEVLHLVDGKVPLIVELKMDGNKTEVCPVADALLRNYKGVYCIESFNPLGVLWYRRNNKKVMRGQLSHAFTKDENKKYHTPLYYALENLWFNFLAKPDFVAYDHNAYRNRSRCICRYVYGGLAVAWTIKSQQELNARLDDFDLFIFDSFMPNDDLKSEGYNE